MQRLAFALCTPTSPRGRYAELKGRPRSGGEDLRIKGRPYLCRKVNEGFGLLILVPLEASLGWRRFFSLLLLAQSASALPVKRRKADPGNLMLLVFTLLQVLEGSHLNSKAVSSSRNEWEVFLPVSGISLQLEENTLVSVP